MFNEAYEKYLGALGPCRPPAFSSRNARAQIIRIATQMLDDSSYCPITIQAVAERAGLSRRAVYNYFENADLLREAAQHVVIYELAACLPPTMNAANPLHEEIPRFVQLSAIFLSSAKNVGLLRSIAARPEPSQSVGESYRANIFALLCQRAELYLLHRAYQGDRSRNDPGRTAAQFILDIEAAFAVPRLFGRGQNAAMHTQVEAVATRFLGSNFHNVEDGALPLRADMSWRCASLCEPMTGTAR